MFASIKRPEHGLTFILWSSGDFILLEGTSEKKKSVTGHMTDDIYKKQAVAVYLVFWASFSINPANALEHDLVIITRPH